MRVVYSVFVVGLSVGCAEVGTLDVPGEPAGAELEIVSPAPGSVHVRDAVGSLGALVALAEFEVAASGEYARIAFETPKGDVLGNAGADLSFLAELAADGDARVVARAYGLDGEVLATDEVEVTVAPPDPDGCLEWLDLYRVEWEPGPSWEGIPQPVRVTVPINGISYRYEQNTTPRESMVMDCALALALARSAPYLRARDIVQVTDYGVYNYRCIGQGTPPDCPNGMSEHAYARALDITGFTTGDGDYFSVNDDWVIDGGGEDTCAAPTESDKDRFLHELVCEMKADGLWHIVLTPNYNAAHRDHFHVDLKPGSDFIKHTGGVDFGPDAH